MRTGRHLWTCAALAMCLGLFAANPTAASPVLALGAGEPAPQPVGGAIGVPALADPVLWYNGDLDYVNSLANCVNGAWGSAAIIYDNFIIPAGETWDVQRIWTNNFMDFSPEFAAWEIRQGVSSGNGGTLVASGTDPCIVTATGAYAPTWTAEYEYTVEVQGLSILLGEGEYWLAVAPVAYGYDPSFCSTTNGGSAIGQPQGDDGNAYIYIPDYGYYFVPTTELGYGDLHDFSMGVAGEVRGGEVIPEPCSLTLLALGGLGLLARRRRKR